MYNFINSFTNQSTLLTIQKENQLQVMKFLKNIFVDTSGWSSVHAYFDNEDLVAKIQLEDDIYVIEVCCSKFQIGKLIF